MTKALTPKDVEVGRARLGGIAAELYARDGADGISMRTLAREAGISRSTPYSYFRDKDEILDCVRAIGFQRLGDVCLHAVASQERARDSLTAMGMAHVLFAAHQPKIYGLMFERPVSTSVSSPELVAAVERLRQAATAPLRECVGLGLFKGSESDLAGTLWAMLHGLAALYLTGHIGDEEELVRRFRLMDQMLDRGLGAEPEPGRNVTWTMHDMKL